ncbi:MAG: thiamine-phosphate kinase [Pseudomonadota bacterium]|nr:thiamine-phosphate kinase [Pseudomonadota bacterium]
MSGELDLIERLRALPLHEGARNLDDDAAVLEIGGETLVLTHDMLVEGVHTARGQDAADVAWKLVATNLSDLAAKGARPVGVLVGFTRGKDEARFVAGLEAALRHYGVPLLGGDTVSGGPPRSHGLTAIGRASHVPVPSRGGARPGDAIWVTGTLGAALAGFEAFTAGDHARARAYLRPQALVGEGVALAPVATAMMDVSDGLLLDAWRMARASGANLVLESAAVPIALPEARRDEALRWGDDYQLLFALPAGLAPPVRATRIGTVEAPDRRGDGGSDGDSDGGGALILDGRPIAYPDGLGYSH